MTWNTEPTGVPTPTVALGRRFTVDTGAEILVLRAASVSDRNQWIRAFEREQSLVSSRSGGVGMARTTSIPWRIEIGDYLLAGDPIGAGGFGNVVQGMHRSTHRRVAAKVLRLDSRVVKRDQVESEIATMGAVRSCHPTRTPCFLPCLFRCCHCWLVPYTIDPLPNAVQLRHKNVVSLLEVLHVDNTAVYLVMELAGGGELFSKVADEERLPVDLARKYFAQILAGAAHCHNHGVAHRDLKLENVGILALSSMFCANSTSTLLVRGKLTRTLFAVVVST